MMSFRDFLEDAEEVLNMIRQSPNYKATAENIPPDFWDRYKKRWGVQGEFLEIRMPMWLIVKLIQDNYMRLSKTNDAGVQNHKGNYNKIIIGKAQAEPQILAVLDGSHSLIAAFQAKEKEIDVVISNDALKYVKYIGGPWGWSP